MLYYYFSRFTSAFSEAHTYAAVGVWLCAASATLCAGQTWKKPLPAVLAMLATPLFFVLFPYSDAYISVYMDTLLGAAFGAALAVALYPGPRRFSYCGLSGLILAALVQIKDSGLFLAIVAAVVFLAVAVNRNGTALAPPERHKTLTKQRMLKAGLFAGAAFIPVLYWRVFLAVTHTPANSFGNPLGTSLPSLLSAAATGENPTAASILERFWVNLQVAPVVYNGYGTALFMAAVLTAAAFVLAVWLWRKRQRGPAIGMGVLPVSFLLYLGGMAVMYLTMLSAVEALRGASYERYMSTFFIGWCMASLAVVLFYAPILVSKFATLVSTVALSAVVALEGNAALNRDVLDLGHAKEHGRYGFEAVSEQMLDKLTPEDRVWVIAQGTDMIYTYMFHYTMLPAKVELHLACVLGYEPTDPEGPEELAAMARSAGVDYMLVYIMDDTFDEKYAAGFSDHLARVRQNNLPSLYRVRPDGTQPDFELVVATEWQA